MAGLDLVARKSLERGSEVSILIPESLLLKASSKDSNDVDDDWSWKKLRDLFDVKNAESLFSKYQYRLQHTVFMLAVMVNIVCCLSALLIIWLNSEDMWNDGKIVLGLRGGSLIASFAIYIISYQESLFLWNWSRVLASTILIVIICAQEMTTSVQVLAEGGVPSLRFSSLPVLVSSVFLPFPRWYQVFLSTAAVITAELCLSGLSHRNSAYLRSQIAADFIYHTGLALTGLFIRFLIEFTNRKAFLDKREYFENKFHLQYAKEQEESLLSSVLPKHIAVQVRDGIRDAMKKLDKSPNVLQRPFTELFVEKHRNVRANMDTSKLTQEMKRHAVLVALAANHGDSEIAAFLNVARSFVFKIRKGLEASGGNVSSVAKRKRHSQRSDPVRKVEFVQQVQGIINDTPSTSMIAIANQLYVSESTIRRVVHEAISILYADIVNSVELTSSLQVSDLVEALNDLFGRLDECAERNFCLRIKLLGDCYQCVTGVPDRDPLHADHCVQMGLDIIEVIRSFREESRVNVDMRIGIHSGNVLSGLLGLRKWQFDIWSRDVTIASRIEQSGKPGCVHVTKATKELLHGRYNIEPVNGNIRDEYLQKCNMDTFLIHPKKRDQAKRDSLFIQVPSSNYVRRHSTQGSRLLRKQSIASEVLSSRRRTVLGFSVLQFRQLVSEVVHSMDTAIDVMAVSKKDQWFNSEGIQPLLLTFRKGEMEKPFLRQKDPLFKHSLLCAIFTAGVLAAISALTKPRLLYVWLACAASFLVVLLSIFSFWIPFISRKLKKRIDLTFFSAFRVTVTSVTLRMVVFGVVFALQMSTALIGMEGCSPITEEFNSSTRLVNSTCENNSVPIACQEPWYFTRSAILVMTSASVFLRVHFLLKLFFTGSSLAAYATLGLTSPSMFSKPYFQDWAPVPAGIDQCWSLAIIWLLLHFLDRQVEYIGRLDYLWERRLRKEQEEASFMASVNQTLLTNILPVHVAHYYLSKESMHLDLDLYHEEYNAVAVMFASIPNYMDFYTESLLNDEGRKCLQVLHEIICDFDKLLYEPTFLKLEKIKTIGSTYMVAAGLQPGRNSSRTSCESFGPQENITQNVLVLTEFAFAMIDTLEELNRNSLQDFKLRIGMSVGPVLAGVVGESKPQYDIWGDTVNLASRMDSTGIIGSIQVTESVATILKQNGKIHCECRGQVFVKGKGLMTTYIIPYPSETTRL